MIDIENDVFDGIKKAVLARKPKTNVVSKAEMSPQTLPCLSIIETNNAVYRRTQDSGSLENHVALVYDINAYSNKASGNKAECKEIIAIADDFMLMHGFTRTSCIPLPMEDASIYRIAARYTAVSDKNKNIYRR